MDYLYINAIVKEVYKDLPCGCPFPAEYRRNLHSVLSGQDCLSNPEFPEVYSFFTLRAKDQMPVLVLGKVQKHTNSASVGRLTQGLGWAVDGKLLLNNLEEMLGADFYSEDEINETALRGDKFVLPKDRRCGLQEIPMTFSAEVKKAILTTVLLRWIRYEDPLRIAVPKNVDYRSYVFSAMKQIYSLFPVSLRARIGFCSYLPSAKNVTDCIGIGFIPEAMADSVTLCLDGSSRAACAALSSGTQNQAQDELIEYLACASDEERRIFLEEFYTEVETKDIFEITIRDYRAMGTMVGLRKLADSRNSQEEQIVQWNKRFFNSKDYEGGKLNPEMKRKLLKQFRETIRPEAFCAWFTRECGNGTVFDALDSAEKYYADNQPLADALWETAVAQLTERKVSYKDIYTRAARRQKELPFVITENGLNALFCKSVEEQFAALSAQSAPTLAVLENLKTKADQLLQYTEVRMIPETPRLQSGIREYMLQLDSRRDVLILRDYEAAFARLKDRPADNMEQTRNLIAEIRSLRESVAEKKIGGAEALLEEIGLQEQALEKKYNALVHRQLAAAFEQLKSKPAETVAQINAVLAPAAKLLSEIEKAAKIPENEALYKEVKAFITAKEEAVNSSDAQFQKIAGIFRSTSDYFQLLLALDKAEKDKLEDNHKATISQELLKRRPAALEAYEKAFADSFRTALSLANVAKLPDYVCGTIVRDICQLNRITMYCDRKQPAAETAANIEGALYTARKISGSCAVTVKYEGFPKDAGWYRDLLRLTHTAQTMGSPGDLENVFYELVDGGAYSGAELIPAVEMVSRCGMKFMKLFGCILEGKFRGCSEQQYRMAFERILAGSGKNAQDALEAMASKANALTGRDKTAYRVFQEFARAHTPKETAESGKIKKILLPVVCGMGVVILALTAAVVVLATRKPEPLPEPTVAITEPAETVPVETEPPVVYPEDFLFYGENKDAIGLLCGTDADITFASQEQKVADLLKAAQEDEELLTLILNRYTELAGTEVKISDEDSVSWEEYFFWNCWYYADKEIGLFRDAMGTVEPIDQVVSVIRLIHNDLQVPAAEEAPAEAAAGEAASAEAAAGSADEAAAAVTEEEAAADAAKAAPVMEDVKAAVIQAAAAPYEAAQAQLLELQQMQTLFGEDFCLNFDEHVKTVESLDLAKNPKFKVFSKHYNQFPGDTRIRIADAEVTWNEYVFWECWLLARRGDAIADTTFDGSLHADVEKLLLSIHRLIPEAEYPANLDALLAEQAVSAESSESRDTENTGEETAETAVMTDEALLLEEIYAGARGSFENTQMIYRVIFEGAMAQ